MKLIPTNYACFIEPEDPVTTPAEMTQALARYFSSQGTSFSMSEESMEPTIEVDGQTYVCRLGESLHAANALGMLPMRSGSMRCLGYQWIYLYKV